jgi:hypothetical protein
MDLFSADDAPLMLQGVEQNSSSSLSFTSDKFIFEILR